MFDFLELEETVGRAWHRLVGDAASYPRHPEHAVTLTETEGSLSVLFRGCGGEAAVQLAATSARTSRHRLTWRQRIGVGEERLAHPGRDGSNLFLPERIDLFPDRAINRALYHWLAAYFAMVPTATIDEPDPLRRDILVLRRAMTTSAATLKAFPGLRASHHELCRALAAARPSRALPKTEAGMENIVRALLGVARPPPGPLWRAVIGDGDLPQRSPKSYQPILPVPLWGDAWTRDEETADGADNNDDTPRPAASTGDGRRRSAVRERKDEGGNRRDPFALNRFEKILAMAEMVNVERPADEDEDEHAERAADELEEITVSRRTGAPATRLRFDLDLPPEAVDRTPLSAEFTYPEWDYRRGAHLPNHCRVVAQIAPEDGERWRPDDATRRHVRRVRRQFEALRPRHAPLRAQPDGSELDLDALVRARSELRAGHGAGDRVYLSSKANGRDLAVTFLIDVSLSTDAWVDDHRVLDVEKEALFVLAHGLSACGDDHAILTFTSRRRSWVRIETVKDFAEPMSAAIERRIGALRPGYYTRIGAAVRHASRQLGERPNRKKLLIVLTDGKPNDVDHYEGRFGIEDSRHAIREARRAGIAVFGITIDRTAQSYFPALFGRSGYTVLRNVSHLPMALPRIYRQLAGS
jgi:nitric oxide reductase NorD protein